LPFGPDNPSISFPTLPSLTISVVQSGDSQRPEAQGCGRSTGAIWLGPRRAEFAGGNGTSVPLTARGGGGVGHGDRVCRGSLPLGRASASSWNVAACRLPAVGIGVDAVCGRHFLKNAACCTHGKSARPRLLAITAAVSTVGGACPSAVRFRGHLPRGGVIRYGVSQIRAAVRMS